MKYIQIFFLFLATAALFSCQGEDDQAINDAIKSDAQKRNRPFDSYSILSKNKVDENRLQVIYKTKVKSDNATSERLDTLNLSRTGDGILLTR